MDAAGDSAAATGVFALGYGEGAIGPDGAGEPAAAKGMWAVGPAAYGEGAAGEAS